MQKIIPIVQKVFGMRNRPFCKEQFMIERSIVADMPESIVADIPLCGRHAGVQHG